MKKEHYYKTAEMKDSSIELKNKFVSIVRYHEYNDTFTIKTIDGHLHIMVDRQNFKNFCL